MSGVNECITHTHIARIIITRSLNNTRWLVNPPLVFYIVLHFAYVKTQQYYTAKDVVNKDSGAICLLIVIMKMHENEIISYTYCWRFHKEYNE